MAFIISLVCFFLTVTCKVYGDDYFFDLETRIDPIFKQVSISSFSGMFQGPNLGDTVGIPQNLDLDRAQLVIRAKMSEIMEGEMRRIFTGLQHIIDSLRKFSKSIHGSLAHSKQQISANPANSEQIAARFVSGLIAEAKLALSEILLQLKKDSFDEVGNVNSVVLRDLFLRIAQDILSDSDLASLEQKILNQMELVISRVFSDQSIPLREDLLNEVLTDLHESIKEISPFINGREAKFQYWVSQQLSFGLQKSQVHIINLRKFAEEVVHSAAGQSKRVCQKAYEYFRLHKENLGMAWKDIEKLVTSVTSYQPVNK